MYLEALSWDADSSADVFAEAAIEFHLTYAGPLQSSGNDGRDKKADHKHEIRLALHSQLKRLWHTSPALEGAAMDTGEVIVRAGPGRPPMVSASHRAAEFKIRPWCFVPLITQDMQFYCGIKILVLHNEPIKPISGRGDLDGRLKTLLDALAVPDANQGYSDRSFEKHYNPLYVLLQDDQQITKVAVETAQMLEPLDAKTPTRFGPNDVRLLIAVSLSPSQPAAWNMPFM